MSSSDQGPPHFLAPLTSENSCQTTSHHPTCLLALGHFTSTSFPYLSSLLYQVFLSRTQVQNSLLIPTQAILMSLALHSSLWSKLPGNSSVIQHHWSVFKMFYSSQLISSTGDTPHWVPIYVMLKYSFLALSWFISMLWASRWCCRRGIDKDCTPFIHLIYYSSETWSDTLRYQNTV